MGNDDDVDGDDVKTRCACLCGRVFVCVCAIRWFLVPLGANPYALAVKAILLPFVSFYCTERTHTHIVKIFKIQIYEFLAAGHGTLRNYFHFRCGVADDVFRHFLRTVKQRKNSRYLNCF